MQKRTGMIEQATNVNRLIMNGHGNNSIIICLFLTGGVRERVYVQARG